MKQELANIIAKNNRLLDTTRLGSRDKRMRVILRTSGPVARLRSQIRYIENTLRANST